MEIVTPAGSHLALEAHPSIAIADCLRGQFGRVESELAHEHHVTSPVAVVSLTILFN